MKYFEEGLSRLKLALLDDAKRIRLQFIWVYCVMMGISFFMTAVNIVTGKFALMCATLIFGILCGVNVLMARGSERALRISSSLFCVEIIILLTYFIVSGIPEGFSAIWACMIPASGLLLFQRKRGSLLCGAMFAVLLFFFETPFGRSLLMYSYTNSFMLRFPMLYVAFFAVSFLLETIRAITFDELKKAQGKYEYLYRHDALTGVYNRYGFNEQLSVLLQKEQTAFSLLILDLDHFKKINDIYGHTQGDIVLREVAALLTEHSGDQAAVCRWGGEEFAVLFPDSADAEKVGWEIISILRSQPIKTEVGSIRTTASIGVASTNGGYIDAQELIRAADACLYASKQNGRNTLTAAAISKQRKP